MEPTLPPSSPRPAEGGESPHDSNKVTDETRPQTTQGKIHQGVIGQRHISHVQGPERKAIQHWAEQAEKLTSDACKSDQNLWAHELYRRNCPQQKPRPLTADESRKLFETIISLEKKYDSLRVSMREFNCDVKSMRGNPGFRETQYFFAVQDSDEDVGDSSRLTLNLHPNKVEEAIKALVEIMHQEPWSDLIRKAKIQALSRLGKTTDCIVRTYALMAPANFGSRWSLLFAKLSMNLPTVSLNSPRWC